MKIIYTNERGYTMKERKRELIDYFEINDKKIINRYETYNNEMENHLNNIQNSKEKISYLYEQKAILEAKLSMSWIWSAMSCILAVLTVVIDYEGISNKNCLELIVMLVVTLILLGVAYARNTLMATYTSKIICIDKWFNELNPTLQTPQKPIKAVNINKSKIVLKSHINTMSDNE